MVIVSQTTKKCRSVHCHGKLYHGTRSTRTGDFSQYANAFSFLSTTIVVWAFFLSSDDSSWFWDIFCTACEIDTFAGTLFVDIHDDNIPTLGVGKGTIAYTEHGIVEPGKLYETGKDNRRSGPYIATSKILFDHCRIVWSNHSNVWNERVLSDWIWPWHIRPSKYHNIFLSPLQKQLDYRVYVLA